MIHNRRELPKARSGRNIKNPGLLVKSLIILCQPYAIRVSRVSRMLLVLAVSCTRAVRANSTIFALGGLSGSVYARLASAWHGLGHADVSLARIKPR
jgi:hypothetical protein